MPSSFGCLTMFEKNLPKIVWISAQTLLIIFRIFFFSSCILAFGLLHILVSQLVTYSLLSFCFFSVYNYPASTRVANFLLTNSSVWCLCVVTTHFYLLILSPTSIRPCIWGWFPRSRWVHRCFRKSIRKRFTKSQTKL